MNLLICLYFYLLTELFILFIVIHDLHKFKSLQSVILGLETKNLIYLMKINYYSSGYAMI